MLSTMCTLYEKTLQLLEESDLPVKDIAAGASVGCRWLFDLKAGRFSDPSVNRIQRIHDFLTTGHPANNEREAA